MQVFQLLGLLLFCCSFLHGHAAVRHHTFVVKEAAYTRLCSTKHIMTINGKFPGETLYVNKGDTLIVDVVNNSPHNITIHWHGVNQPRYPWSDGPEYITQCPIQPGGRFIQKVIFTTEEGTLWWHAHSEWTRATVYGAIVVYPKKGDALPFPKPEADVPIIFDMFKIKVKQGKTYLFRLVNAAMQDIIFFSVADHHLTVVGTDGTYTKPFKSNYITISPGQTIDVLLKANQPRNKNYYMAAKFYSSARANVNLNTATAIIQYTAAATTSNLPTLPASNDTNASVNFTARLRSLADMKHPIDVPKKVDTNLYFTISMNVLPCPPGSSCSGPSGDRLASSINNISFVANTSADVLRAYYNKIGGVYGDDFPSEPPKMYNFTNATIPAVYRTPMTGNEVKVLEYNSSVELVFQGTNLLGGVDHPMHLHGTNFYVVGWGFGNFDKENDHKSYNLVDPPFQNTIAVPRNGWVANGKAPNAKMLPPPPDMPRC
ncbi:LAC14 [Linum grandiflorum]